MVNGNEIKETNTPAGNGWLWKSMGNRGGVLTIHKTGQKVEIVF